MSKNKEAQHLFDTVISENDTCKWQRFTPEAQVWKPSYESPFTVHSFEAEIKDQFNCSDMCYGYIPLGYYSVPMWPHKVEDCVSVYDVIFVQCIECDTFCLGPSQMILQFYFPSTIINRKGYHWTWIPRVRCSDCSHAAGVENLHELVYFPLIIHFHGLATDLLEVAIKQCEPTVLHSNRVCFVCDKELSKTQSKRARKAHGVPLCRDYCCIETHHILRQIDDNYDRVDLAIPGLFRLLELLDYFKETKLDINYALRSTICGQHMGGCPNRGKPAVRCEKCHRVTFCKLRCKRIDRDRHKENCHYPWDETFDRKNLVLQK